MARLAILLSGSGTNFEAIHRAIAAGEIADTEIVCVISNIAEARGLERAKNFGYPTYVVAKKEFAGQVKRDTEIIRILQQAEVDLVVLAGYMRMLSSPVVTAFSGRIINIHPSLLPQFPGLNAQKQALDAGVAESGCTVHYVDEGMDSGEIIVQRRLVIDADETIESLSQRIQKEEHRAFPEAIRLVLAQLS